MTAGLPIDRRCDFARTSDFNTCEKLKHKASRPSNILHPRGTLKCSELYGALIEVAFPLLIIHVEFLLAVPSLVQFTADESDDEFAFLVHDFFATAA